MTSSAGRAGAVIDIEAVMDRYGLNLSAARVLKVIDRLVYASRLNGKVDKRGVPYCYASKEWIAEKIGKSLRTVARAIHDLKAAGMIECKRTRSNALLFITGYEVYDKPEPEQPAREEEAAGAGAPSYASETATCGTSGSDTNGTSNITPKSNNNIPVPYPSIGLSITRQGKTDGKDYLRCHDPEREDRWIDVHVKLMDRLVWCYGQLKYDQVGKTQAATIANYVADAVAGERRIRVNGATMSPEQYWNVVKDLNNDARLRETLERVAGGAELGEIRCERAYILAAVYNCALWQRYARNTEADTDYWMRRRLA